MSRLQGLMDDMDSPRIIAATTAAALEEETQNWEAGMAATRRNISAMTMRGLEAMHTK